MRQLPKLLRIAKHRLLNRELLFHYLLPKMYQTTLI